MPASTKSSGICTDAFERPVRVSVTRIRSQRAPPPAPGGRGGGGMPRRESLNAASSFEPSSALILPSSIIFRIFILSSLFAMFIISNLFSFVLSTNPKRAKLFNSACNNGYALIRQHFRLRGLNFGKFKLQPNGDD